MAVVDEAKIIEAAASSEPPAAAPPAREGGGALGWVRAGAAQVVHLLWPVVLVIAVWALWVELGDLPPAVAPHPFDVVRYIADNAASYLGDALNTLLIVVGGLLVGAAVGVGLASLAWFSPIARATISGPALVTQCLPVATMVPVLARVFGYNQRTVVIIAALIAFFPVLVFTTSGLRETPPGADDLFVVLGAGRWQRFRRLAVPAALPRALVALRLSVVAAVVGAMLAQWIMGAEGLGYRLVVAQASFRMSEAWGASVVAIVLSVLLYVAVAALCRAVQNRFE